MKYETISQRENIEDDNIVKAIDYIERVARSIKICWRDIDTDRYEFIINENIIVCFDCDEVSVCNCDDWPFWMEYTVPFIEMDQKIFAENIVWLWGNIKNYKN